MSCLQKRLKKTNSEEKAFQEHLKKVAQDNGTRLGESAIKIPEARRVRLFCQQKQGMRVRTIFG